MADTLVFIPAWNEEDNLPAVLDELREELPEADVLVVDDGSTDGTADVAREHGAAVISFEQNRGLPGGIAAGYGYAAEHGYAWCGRVDADGQHPVAELARLLERVARGLRRRGRLPLRERRGLSRRTATRRRGPRRLRHGVAAAVDGGRAAPAVPRRDERHVRGQRAGDAGARASRTRAGRPRSRRCCG